MNSRNQINYIAYVTLGIAAALSGCSDDNNPGTGNNAGGAAYGGMKASGGAKATGGSSMGGAAGARSGGAAGAVNAGGTVAGGGTAGTQTTGGAGGIAGTGGVAGTAGVRNAGGVAGTATTGGVAGVMGGFAGTAAGNAGVLISSGGMTSVGGFAGTAGVAGMVLSTGGTGGSAGSAGSAGITGMGGAAGTAGAAGAPGNGMSFFVSSDTNTNGNLGGLVGADARCQALATAVGRGSGVWHAYLSAEPTAANGDVTTNARDRIGNGPWYNANGILLAITLTDLHNLSGNADLFVDEHGARINGNWSGSPTPVEHDILTGSSATGTVMVGFTCANWTSNSTNLSAQVGHSDGLGPAGSTTPPYNSWNSAHANESCADTAPRGGAGRLYCFLVR